MYDGSPTNTAKETTLNYGRSSSILGMWQHFSFKNSSNWSTVYLLMPNTVKFSYFADFVISDQQTRYRNVLRRAGFAQHKRNGKRPRQYPFNKYWFQAHNLCYQYFSCKSYNFTDFLMLASASGYSSSLATNKAIWAA